MKLSKLQAGLIILLFVLLLTGTASALPDDDRIAMRDPPPQPAGERVPVFLVLNEQPQQFASFNQLKADALSRQAQVLQTVRAVDSTAFKTARSYWIANAVWLEADPATLDRLAAIPGVSRIEPDLTVTLNDPVAGVSSTINPDSISRPKTEYATVWSADFIEAPSVWKSGNTGEGVTIAVIDTGIDGDHPVFDGRIIAFADFVDGLNETPYDDHGHGTHCAGTAAGGTVSQGGLTVTLGVAPGANLIGAKVLDSGGSGPFSTIFDGVQWAIDNGADVVSMSLGTYVSRDESASDFYLSEGESRNITLEVSSEMYGDTDCLYEPQFVIGSVRVEDPYYYATAADYGFADPLANLTITLTDAQGRSASGAEVDWLGFDQKDNRYYFKAPYALNTAGWNGVWELNVTNTGAAEVWIEEIGLSECYQSNGETILDTAVNNIVKGGTVVAVAAGNDGWYGTSTIGTPGTAKDAITVGATDYLMDYRASFSSMGPVNRAVPYVKPDVMAPGVGIISAYPEGQYASMQGTSMACPAVAGAAALMLSGNATLTPADVKAAMMETAVHIGEDGAILPAMQKNNAYGAGRINAYEAVNTTGGLGGTKPSDGVLRELIGGTLTSYSVTGNTLPVMAVLWNTTAGKPMAGEDVDISVWYDDYYNYQSHFIYVVNQTLRTDANGSVYYGADISGAPGGNYVYTRIAYGDLRVEDWVYKYPVTPTPNPVVPIYESEYYSVPHNATVPIKYPLLTADGSPYTGSVTFTVNNSSERIVEKVLVPVDGVISYSLDLAGRPLDETNLDLGINGRGAGSVSVGQELHSFQEVIPLPSRAICPPGKSVDLGVMARSHHGQKTVSQDIDVYVTTLTETEVLSLSSTGARTLSAPDQGDMQALLAEIAGMKPETRTGTVSLTNGIGLLNFTMPKDGYIAIVRFVSPHDYMPTAMSPGEATTVLVYGTLEPWLMHRSTPPVYEDFHDGNLTYIYSYPDWPATWDQDAYASVPADEATITAYVYTYDPVTRTSSMAPGQTVYLYTENGVETGATGEDGVCTFTVDTTGKTRMDYLLATAGISGSMGVGTGVPFDLYNQYSVNPGMIVNGFAVPAYIGALSPDSETYIAGVVRDGDAYNVIARSYGPAGEPIHEKGFFTLNRRSTTYIWDSEATEAAAVVEFTGTETRRVTPAAEGHYEVMYGLLNPNRQSIGRYLFTTLRHPERSVSYTMPDSVLVGSSVPVVFNVSTGDGAPISGARVVLAAGAAGGWDWSSSNDDPRDANILLAADYYPDPYTVIATGYTDANGKVTLTFTAPTAGQQALRESLAHASDIPYLVACYHDGELVQEDDGYLAVKYPGEDTLIADFTANTTTGPSPLTVRFTDTSTGSPTNWFWSFGDGATSTEQHPIHTYTTPGNYSVSLTVTNTAGSNTTTRAGYVTVSPAPGQDILWDVPLGITSGTLNRTMTLGSAESATRGFDAELDLPAPPEPPGTSESAYFTCTDPTFGQLSTDYKPQVDDTNPEEFWTLSIRSDDPVQVTWNTTLLADSVLSLTWDDGTNTIAMKTTNGTTLPAGSYNVNISASIARQMDLSLQEGWNLVSTPFSNAAYTVPEGAILAIYGYNPSTKGYETVSGVTALVPGEAYWIASARNCTVTVTGTPVIPVTAQLKQGWNLIGSTAGRNAFDGIAIAPTESWAMPFVYGYNPQTKGYVQSTELQPGEGYWGAVTRDCTITLP